MALAPNPGPSATTATGGLAAVGLWRLLAVAAPQLAALVVMFQTETDLSSRIGFLLSWGILNFFWIALLRRPALSGALSLTLVVVLVLLSRLKHDVVQMTANFVDLMVIDRDTAAFLFTIFPHLRWSVIAAAAVTIPLMYALWWLDPFRIRRLPAVACALACLAALVGYAFAWPDEAWRGYYDDGYLSKFSRSGVTAVSDFIQYGFMESDAVAHDHLNVPLVDSCHPAGRRPNIIMIHDESSFDIRQAEGVKVPAGYGSYFNSFDGKARKFLAESNGGPSWFTEYNVLAGLSSRSFGRFAYFVTRIASGRVERGLPLALRRCGYSTLSLYPAFGAFMSARSFQATTGIEHFYDAHDLGAKDVEPDSFFYDKALTLMSEQTPATPLFAFVYLGANHFPWETRFRPDLMPSWRNPGNEPVVDEYLRRQAMSVDRLHFVHRRAEKEIPGPAVPDRALWRSSAGILAAPARSRSRRSGDRQEADELRPALLRDLLRDRRDQFRAGQEPDRDGHHRRRLSAAGDPGSRRHSARSVVRGAEEDHASLQRRVLCLQGRRGGPPLQPPADRRRHDQGIVVSRQELVMPGLVRASTSSAE